MPDIPRKTKSRVCRGIEEDVESCVQFIMKQIANEVDWTTNINDEGVIADWQKEPNWSWYAQRNWYNLTLKCTIEECKWRHTVQWKHRAGIPATICKAGLVLSSRKGCGDISPEFRASMMEDLDRLQQAEEHEQTTVVRHHKYDRILHLVHPSMYAYEKGVTHVLDDAGAEVVEAPDWDNFLGTQGTVNKDKVLRPDKKGLRNNKMYGSPYSRFEENPPTAAECSTVQWLPSEFYVSSSTTAAAAKAQDEEDKMIIDRSSKATASKKAKSSINSYINNLHPVKYKSLYSKIEDLFVEVLPLMEEVLSEVNDNGQVRKQLPRFSRQTRPVGGNKQELRPRIPKFVPPEYTASRSVVNLHDRPVQVIVKLISMELEPEPDTDTESISSEESSQFSENPPHYFNRGHWHVEGTHDERIVASACCYLYSDNVEEEGLSFRDGSVGCDGTELGTCSTYPGRILVWPNYLHHKTGDVILKDETKPGRRTICCFHLVDPTLRIRSTATVPPQQESWMSEMVDCVLLKAAESQNNRDNNGVEVIFDELVLSTIHNISSMFQNSGTINYQQAIERRQRLSKERRADSEVIADNFWIPDD